ncbi:cellulose biosynthesis protein BcsQ [Vibrio aphrogenes]|uniref:cellulose biosynthesis protein BcsQ n=1 Tax=Vibrio aphrogenes TaxID=1891186 RepID=UPI000B358CCF|nr:cellulose biosynthesis protein BcsQ [Vibrio aphrogenes]
MSVICVYSPKGGVGKTTLTANLAYSLARTGLKVLVIDFDAQNSLGLHFGLPLSDNHGYVAQSSKSSDWSDSVLTAGSNIFVLPYGNVTEQEQTLFEHNLTTDELFLSRGLHSLLNYPGLVIIADLPSGRSPALKALSPLTTMYLVPLLPDTASLSLLPHIENKRLTNHKLADHYFVINQVDHRRNVSRDVSLFMKERLGEKLLGEIHKDESVVEAHAAQKLVFNFNPASSAAFDIEIVSKKVISLLSLNIGNGAI